MFLLSSIVLVWACVYCAKQLRRGSGKQVNTVYTAPGKLACITALEMLQAQRDELNEQLDTINSYLDAAPPEKERLRWIKERTRVYGQLAAVEQKIHKLTH